jgi:hypothetical protein
MLEGSEHRGSGSWQLGTIVTTSTGIIINIMKLFALFKALKAMNSVLLFAHGFVISESEKEHHHSHYSRAVTVSTC